MSPGTFLCVQLQFSQAPDSSSVGSDHTPSLLPGLAQDRIFLSLVLSPSSLPERAPVLAQSSRNCIQVSSPAPSGWKVTCWNVPQTLGKALLCEGKLGILSYIPIVCANCLYVYILLLLERERSFNLSRCVPISLPSLPLSQDPRQLQPCPVCSGWPGPCTHRQWGCPCASTAGDVRLYKPASRLFYIYFTSDTDVTTKRAHA